MCLSSFFGVFSRILVLERGQFEVFQGFANLIVDFVVFIVFRMSGFCGIAIHGLNWFEQAVI